MMERASRAGIGPVGALATRLAALAGIFTVAVLLELRGAGPYGEAQLTALYALVLAGFLLSLAYAVVAFYQDGRAGSVAFEAVGDGCVITGLVYCTGGAGSLFGFLYIPWIVNVASRGGGRGTVYSSLAAILAYGTTALGMAVGWIPPFADGPVPPIREAATSFGFHAAAFLSVTLLARRLQREVQRGQDELMELGALHQRIVDNVSSGLLTVDGSGRITSFNRAAEEITGIAGSDVLGWDLRVRFPGLPEAADARVPGRRGELRFESDDRGPMYLGFSRSVLRDSEGMADGEVLIFQDLTLVREMEERLRRSERLSAVGQLATGLAHEIRNPLASLSGAIELLGDDLTPPDAASRRLLRIVERETARLNRLVVDFLSYAGGRTPVCEAVRVRELVDEIQALLTSGKHADVDLVVDVPDSLAAWGDPDQLRQVLWNLILNAAQAEPEDGKVRVSACAVADDEPSRVRIQVEDRGRGISHEVLERAFEPFFTTKAKGTGLGLATVHRIVEAHGGDLEVQSEPGRGTTVSVFLEQARG